MRVKFQDKRPSEKMLTWEEALKEGGLYQHPYNKTIKMLLIPKGVNDVPAAMNINPNGTVCLLDINAGWDNINFFYRKIENVEVIFEF